jgi:signal transduction histidine kinase/ActR/RegA family two-component response regulator
LKPDALIAAVVRRPVQLFAAMAGAGALFALAAWAAGDWRILSLRPDSVPMSPSTALALLLLSCAVFVQNRWPLRSSARILAGVAALAAFAIGLLVPVQSLLGLALPVEGWLTSATELAGDAPVGRMSPLTATALLLAGIACCLESPRLGGRRLLRQAAAAAALGVFGLAAIVLVSYAAGVPLLQGTDTIPMALLTAVALIPLALGLLIAAGPDTLPLALFLAAPETAAPPSRDWNVGAPLWTFLVLAAGIGTVGYCYFMHQVSMARQTAKNELSAIADMKVRQVSAWHNERLRDAGFFLEASEFASLAAAMIADPSAADATDRLRTSMLAAQTNYRYGRMLLVDRDQRVRLAVPADKDWLGPTTKASVARALRTGQIQVADLHRSRMVPGAIDMDIFVPMFPQGASDGHREPVGVLAFEINPHEFLFPVVQSWPTLSRTAEALLVRREGDETMYLNEVRHRAGSALNWKVPLERTNEPAVRATLGQESVAEGVDYRDVPVLAAVRAVPGTPWFLVAKVDKAEVDAPIRERGRITGALVLVFLVVAALGVGFMGRQRDTRWLRSQLAVEREYAIALETANKALEESSFAAAAATRAKSEFLANMSHEIRTPMAAILGYTDLIDEVCRGQCSGGHDLPTAVAVIRRNGAHLLELINDILDLSKVESGKTELQRVRCSPFDLLADVAALTRGRVENKGLKVEAEAAGPLPETILTDPLRLRQVLINLAGNAVKFTEEGTVRITACLVADDGPPRLRFDVADTGIGMTDEQLQRLFRPFSQVDTSASRRFGGSGLGLAISKRLVEALGGTIAVRSVPGKGSTFSVTVDPGPLDGIRMLQQPAVDALTPAVATPAIEVGSVQLHARLLLVEDGLDNQRLIGFLLKKAGAHVTTVENGQLAVEAVLAQKAAGCPFDVILMDMQMPVMDGYHATRTIRAQGYAGPILALTAHAMADDRQKCLDAGCDDYLSKPIDRRQLLLAVAKWTRDSGRAVCAK